MAGLSASFQKKLFIETFGCQMNVDDSLRMSRLLVPLNYRVTADPSEADLVLINTCSVREKASHKASSAIGRYSKLKHVRPELMLGLTGCQAQVEGVSFLKRFSSLDFVLGPDQVGRLPEVVRQLEQGQARSMDRTARIKPADFDFVNLVLDEHESLVSAYVTIMKGCDNFCSFCIVPFVRGREVSRPSDEIIREIQNLCEHGVQEVTLLGQNVNSYGTKKTGELSFTGLLYQIAEKTPVQRIRFTTSHPKDVDQELIDAFRKIPGLAKHVHLPVQSGSSSVLKRMYRTYTREEYLQIVHRLRESCPEIAITTDFIIGFSGETEEEFAQSLSLIDEAGFDAAYSFVYSPRPFTTAGRYLKDDVDSQVKENRLRLLQARQLELSYQKNQQCLGQIFEVLIEGPSKLGFTLQGRTTHNRIMHLDLVGEGWIGKMISAKAVKATPTALVGEPSGSSLGVGKNF